MPLKRGTDNRHPTGFVEDYSDFGFSLKAVDKGTADRKDAYQLRLITRQRALVLPTSRRRGLADDLFLFYGTSSTSLR